MSPLDNAINSFASQDLKNRIRGVVAFGIVLIALSSLAGYVFLNRTYTVDVSGTATLANGEGHELEITLAPNEFKKMESYLPSKARAKLADGSWVSFEIGIEATNPATGLILADSANLPNDLSGPRRFEIRLVLYEGPFWKMLWGSKNR